MKHLVLVEWDTGEHPFRVVHGEQRDGRWYFDETDVDWSRRDRRCYFHHTGGYPDAIYFNQRASTKRLHRLWLHPDVPIETDEGKPLAREQLRERGFRLVDEQPEDPLPGLDEERTEWCFTCKDFLPTENLCGHLAEETST